MSTRFILWTIWCLFLTRALFLCTAIPLWEGYDEFSHFALIQYVSAHHGGFPLGVTPPNSSRTVGESRKLAPSAWILRDAAGGILSYEDYFDLSAGERSDRRARLEQLPAEWSRQEAAPREPLYEAQQAPLYYWIMAPIYHAIGTWTLPHAVWLLRLLTALLASSAIPLVFLAARRAMQDEAIALGAIVLVALLPEFLILISHVGNEGLSVAIGGAFMLLALRTMGSVPSLWSGVRFGSTLGTALLTKAYFVALLPLAVVVLWLAWRRDALTRGKAIAQAAIAAGCCAGISGWWYVHNLRVTGSLTGQAEDIQGMANRTMSLLTSVSRIHWVGVFDFMAASHIWLGGWSFLIARSWMYRVVEFVVVMAMIGICTQAIRGRADLPGKSHLAALTLPYLSLIAGLCLYAAQVFRTRGAAVTPGYYLYALIAPEAILLVAGLARLMPFKTRLLPLPFVALAMIGMEQFGSWFLMFPYYGGLIRHNTIGNLPAAHIQQYANGGVATLFGHLGGIGPVSSPTGIETAAILYLVATTILLWFAYRIYQLSPHAAK